MFDVTGNAASMPSSFVDEVLSITEGDRQTPTIFPRRSPRFERCRRVTLARLDLTLTRLAQVPHSGTA